MNDELAEADDTQSLNDVPQGVSSEQEEVPTVHRVATPRPPITRTGPGLPAAFGWLLLLVTSQSILGTALYLILAIFGLAESAIFFAMIVATVATLLLAFVLVSRKYGRTAFSKLSIRLPNLLHSTLLLLLVFPLFLTLATGTSLLALVFRWAGAPDWMVEIPGMQQSTELTAQLPSWAVTAYVVVFLGLMPGVGEELLFRGYIGRGLIARWGRWAGVALTSFLFGLVHLHPLHAIFAAAQGVILHGVYLWTRSLIAVMFLHAAYNSTAFLWVLYLDPQNTLNITVCHLAITLLASMVILLVLFFTRVQRVGTAPLESPQA